MAKQIGPIKITGTLGDLTFYQLNGAYYVRSTTRISKKRLKNDPCFARFRHAQQRFKTASLLVKSVYYGIPKEKRYNGLYVKLTAQALPMVKQGMSSEAILKIILAPFEELQQKQTAIQANPRHIPGTAASEDSGPRISRDFAAGSLITGTVPRQQIPVARLFRDAMTRKMCVGVAEAISPESRDSGPRISRGKQRGP